MNGDYNKDLKERHSKRIFQKAGQYCWETPNAFFEEYNKEFRFNLDVCANKENHKCDIYFSEEQDGLKQDWGNNVCWMNPPYGHKISHWVKKAYQESQKGATVVLLLPVRTDTKWWWDYCMKGEIRFIKGRVKFQGRNTKGKLVNYPATFPSAIVIFRANMDTPRVLCQKKEEVDSGMCEDCHKEALDKLTKQKDKQDGKQTYGFHPKSKDLGIMPNFI